MAMGKAGPPQTISRPGQNDAAFRRVGFRQSRVLEQRGALIGRAGRRVKEHERVGLYLKRGLDRGPGDTLQADPLGGIGDAKTCQQVAEQRVWAGNKASPL